MEFFTHWKTWNKINNNLYIGQINHSVEVIYVVRFGSNHTQYFYHIIPVKSLENNEITENIRTN